MASLPTPPDPADSQTPADPFADCPTPDLVTVPADCPTPDLATVPADCPTPDLLTVPADSLHLAPSSRRSSVAASSSRALQRQSLAVSFDKTVLNTLKLDAFDLDIQKDALIVVDKEKRRKNRRTCDFGFTSNSAVYRRSIPLYNVLWAEVGDVPGDASNQQLVIDYAEHASKTRLQAAQLAIPLTPTGPDRPTPADAATWAELLRARAYEPDVPMRRRAYVLVNPHAGPGGALRKWETQVRPLFEAARMALTVVTTTHSGQAVELCAALDLDQYDIIVPCSGDGLAHEVFNGLGQRPDARRALARLAVAHVPCGSGNAMACNLYGTHRASLAALAIVKGVVAPLDLVSITQGDRRLLSFLSQAVGIVAEADLATEHLRWMGEARFTWGFLQRFMARRVYPCDLAVKVEIDHKEGVRAHYTHQRQLELEHDHEHERTASHPALRDRAKLDSSETTTTTVTTTATSATSAMSATSAASAISATSATSISEEDEAGGSQASASEGLPPLRYGTVNDKLPDGWEFVSEDKIGNFYCGNMAYMAPDANFFSAALMSDGLVDLVTINGDIPLHKSLGMISSVENGHFFDNPLVRYRKIAGYRLVPRNQQDGYISIDGERIDFAPFQAEVHRGLGRVIANRQDAYEAPGPRNWDKVSVAERMLA